MIAVVDYGAGNLRSLQKACERVGLDVETTCDAERLSGADRLILPGVGAFRDAMRALSERGLDRLLRAHCAAGKPLLGICLGHQLLFEESEEDGPCRGLGLIEGRVVRIAGGGIKVPHMGWNNLRIRRGDRLLKGIEDGELMYFVHSYTVLCDAEYRLAETDYGAPLVAAVASGTVFGVQFHPEKSGERGLRILQNFGEL